MGRHDPLIDTMAGNYRLVARLGAGGMGEVYKGVHGQIGSKVAIKLLHAMAARDNSLQQRFLLEAKAVNRIEHPGIVKVIDAGRTDGGRPFLVMELLEGASLHELRKEGKLTISEACRSMVDVLDALAAAHAAGVIHRDLKPANLFRTREGRTVVLDFGVAKLMANDAPVRLTMTGSAVGTPHYMAPEQIRGEPATPSVDIYAAGVVLFELLCGRRPFDNTDDESVMVGHLERRPPPPRALEPAIPIAVQDLILAALQKDPAKRPRSALAMRDALRAATDGVASSAVREPPSSASIPTLAATPSAKAPRPSRLRTLALVGAALFALLGVILIVYAAKRSRADRAASEPTVAKPAVPVDALFATCAQLVTIDPVGVADAQHAAVQAAFFQRCAEDRWDVAVIHCFVTVTTVVDLARCIGALTPDQRDRLESALDVKPKIAESIGDAKSMVSIQSYPSGAAISIDGVQLGKTPWAGQLPLANAIVEFAMPGYKPRSASINVRGDRPNVLKVVLIRARRAEDTELSSPYR
ncbi:MAG: protein kinase [Myxococcota bacterium]|nr:protein kinase [Deltaproteobacteria bacterium]MDQ3334137.1 protein kinase [Myxococcota bacterium]